MAAGGFGNRLGGTGRDDAPTAIAALGTEGIQRGHMRLHSKSIALMAGAIGEEIEKISLRMIQEDKISLHNAENFLALLRRMSGEPGE